MHWRVGTFAELEHLSDDDRRRLLKEYAGPRMISMMIVRSVVLGWLGGVLAAGLILRHLPPEIGTGLFVLVMVLGAVVVYQLQIIRIHGQLRIFLERVARKAPLPMCMRCGYSLEGLSPDRCPECGFPIGVGPR